MSTHTISVLLVDDHPVVRKGLRALLETDPIFEVIGEAGNGREAVALAEELKPRVILMDLFMPEMDGVQAIQQIVSRQPEARILVLTSFGTDTQLFPAIKAGALGYLLKDASPADVLNGVREAAEGRSSLNPGIARRLLRELSGHDPARPAESLTQRETEVLQLVAHGLSNDQIAGRLFISEATVRTHMGNILGKLGLSNRTQVALYALRTGLASLEDDEPTSR